MPYAHKKPWIDAVIVGTGIGVLFLTGYAAVEFGSLFPKGGPRGLATGVVALGLMSAFAFAGVKLDEWHDARHPR